MSCGAPARGAEKALPSADASNLTTARWRRPRALLGNASEGSDGRCRTPRTRLRAASPHACRFIIVRGGRPVYRHEGTELDWQPDRPGKYRLEAELHILEEWAPWIYTNPVELAAS